MKCLSIGALALLSAACSPSQPEGTRVRIETSAGDIVVRLYDDTPLHRDNFLRLAREGVYDSILWHRIVPDLMIQTGDPARRPRPLTCQADTASLRYTVPQEIRFPRYMHKRGALAAARQPDRINPKKASSATQWYIVTGKVYTPGSLAEFGHTLYQDAVSLRWSSLQDAHEARLKHLERTDEPAYDALQDSILTAAETHVANHPPRPFNEAQKKVYTTLGGCPHLDGEYTVFGEVVEGMRMVDQIAQTPTDEWERPLREIVVKRVSVLE